MRLIRLEFLSGCQLRPVVKVTTYIVCGIDCPWLWRRTDDLKLGGLHIKGLNSALGRGLQKAKLEICAENCISCKGWFIIFSMLEHVELWILFTHFNGFSRQLDVAAEKNYFFFLEIWKYLCCLVGLGDLFAEHKQEQQKAKFPDQRQTSSKYFLWPVTKW